MLSDDDMDAEGNNDGDEKAYIKVVSRRIETSKSMRDEWTTQKPNNV